MATRANDTTMAILDEIFAAFPGRFRFTSGCRTPSQNAAVNGNANSYHLTTRGCQAADFVPIDGRFGDKDAIGAIVGRHGYEVIQHNAGSGEHYHIEPAPGYTGGGSGGQSQQTQETDNSLLLYGMLGILFVLLITD